MVAVGNLNKIWLEVPQTSDPEILIREFEKYFGAYWHRVKVGADKPFASHIGWQAYFAVSGFKLVQDLMLSELRRQLLERDCQVHSIIIGL